MRAERFHFARSISRAVTNKLLTPVALTLTSFLRTLHRGNSIPTNSSEFTARPRGIEFPTISNRFGVVRFPRGTKHAEWTITVKLRRGYNDAWFLKDFPVGNVASRNDVKSIATTGPRVIEARAHRPKEYACSTYSTSKLQQSARVSRNCANHRYIVVRAVVKLGSFYVSRARNLAGTDSHSKLFSRAICQSALRCVERKADFSIRLSFVPCHDSRVIDQLVCKLAFKPRSNVFTIFIRIQSRLKRSMGTWNQGKLEVFQRVREEMF